MTTVTFNVTIEDGADIKTLQYNSWVTETGKYYGTIKIQDTKAGESPEDKIVRSTLSERLNRGVKAVLQDLNTENFEELVSQLLSIFELAEKGKKAKDLLGF